MDKGIFQEKALGLKPRLSCYWLFDYLCQWKGGEI
jgi:hypothetical protein